MNCTLLVGSAAKRVVVGWWTDDDVSFEHLTFGCEQLVC